MPIVTNNTAPVPPPIIYEDDKVALRAFYDANGQFVVTAHHKIDGTEMCPRRYRHGFNLMGFTPFREPPM